MSAVRLQAASTVSHPCNIFTTATLAQTLAAHNGADLARSVGVSRTMIHRLKHGAPLHDRALIVPLADALGIDLATFMLVVDRDTRRRLVT